mmetsp:Transcript_53564/g.116776  ORF Transcript_53564/g.116776 Transcript_53564/m.116776 type:complete len:611 (+) Transcript_53564:72-1904(+)
MPALSSPSAPNEAATPRSRRRHSNESMQCNFAVQVRNQHRGANACQNKVCNEHRVRQRLRLASLICTVLTSCACVQAAPSVWPMPYKSVVPGSAALPTRLSAPPRLKFFLLPRLQSSPLLTTAFERYAKLTFPHTAFSDSIDSVECGAGTFSNANPIEKFVISVSDCDESHPTLNTDESYTIATHSRHGYIPSYVSATAATVYGALRALETWSQLVKFDFDCGTYYFASVTNITDAPRFPHRGLMIDTARHYQPLAAVKAIVDSLPYAKLNVLHWHMADSQSFPFQSLSRPRLWRGAYPHERYTQGDVAAVVEHARLRGVRVVVEFDMPGHADSWCVGYPWLCPSASCTTPLNVAANATFDLIADLLGECTGRKKSSRGAPSGLFPDELLHLGGDEVNTQCWEQVPAVARWLKARNMSADDGYAYFVKRVAATAIAQGRRPVQWAEVFDHFKSALPKETVVHVWRRATNVTQVLELGYNVLRNVGYDNTSWYLDNLNVDWRGVYANDACAGVPSPLCGLVLGGHGEMWGETVDASDLEQTVWPRLAAVAEKLWSAEAHTRDVSAQHVEQRLLRFRCLLNERGVRAAPVRNTKAREAPPGPGACESQRRRS